MPDVTTLGIGVDSSGVVKATDHMDAMTRASKKTADAATDVEKSHAQMSRSVIAQGSAMGIVIADVARQAASLAKSFVQAGISLGHYQDLAEMTNADPAGLASMQVAADVAGVSLENMGLMMTRLTANLSRAKDDTTGAAKALNALGINTKTFIDLKADEQYKLIAERMNTFADSSGKVAAAQVLFGRGGAQQLQLMKELGEQGSITNLVTNEMIKRSDDLSDSMTRQWSKTSQLIKVLSAEGLLGAMSDVVTVATEVAKSFGAVDKSTGKIDATPLQKFADDVVDAFAEVIRWSMKADAWLKAVNSAYGAAGEIVNNYFTGDLSTLADRNRAARARAGDQLQKDLDAADAVPNALKKARLERLTAGFGKTASSWSDDGKPPLPFKAAKDTVAKALHEKVGGIPDYMKEYLKLEEAEEKFMANLERRGGAARQERVGNQAVPHRKGWARRSEREGGEDTS